MADKREHQGGDGDAASKRARTDDGTPAPPTAGVKLSVQEQIAAAKARAAAAKERIMAMKSSAAASGAAAGGTQSPADAARARVEAMKARVAAATASSRSGGPAPPVRSAAPTPPSYQAPPPPPPPESSRLTGGLGIGLHPALMGDLGGSAVNRQATGTRFSTTLGNRQSESAGLAKGKKQLDLSAPTLDELKKNPYFDASLGAPAIARGRSARELIFNEKGKYIAQAAALRRQQALEQMKKRIAEQSRKAGLDEDKSEQAFVVAAPPEREWWDEGLIDGETYPDFDDDAMAAEQKLKINTEDSIVTRYIQHPVLLAPPQEKNIPAPKPMFLTKEEMKKKRRQSRQIVLKEKQAKQRLGLVPPEPPKVKKSNLMRVLGEQAVKDPTAVEQRVNREIAERQEKHEQENEDRKLTKEERHEKLQQQQEKDAAKGVYMCVFRIDNLSFGKHRYKVDNNAKQHLLTGITIMNPKLNLVVVEGGAYSINKYKKLMLQRIDWTEIAPPPQNAKEPHEKDEAARAWWMKPDDDKGELKDLSENRCILIWEGQVKERSFKKWSSKVCETDGDARRALERMKMENMWQTAKNWSSNS